MGAPRSFEMTRKSVALGNDEWERLDWEARASQALFTQFGEITGPTQVVLMQPAHLSGIDEPKVPRIQEDELCVRNAGINLRNQA